MKLFVGIANQTLVDLAKAVDSDAQLITEDNVSANFAVGYTGIEEFPVDNTLFLNLLLSADEIFYYPETFTTTAFDIENPTGSSRGLTDNFLLLALQEGVTVHNFEYLGQDVIAKEQQTYLALADQRKDGNSPQLWGAGCSFTYGAGVNVSERYINLLGQQLDMPVNCLANVGASIVWAADQILRSDIRAGDLVVWGLTTKARLPLVYKKGIYHVSIDWIEQVKGFEREFLIQLLTNEDQLSYQQQTAVEQVTNFCKRAGANLLLLGLLTSATDRLYFSSNPNFYQCSNDYIDLGTDNIHPGPLQHRAYADIVIGQLLLKDII